MTAMSVDATDDGSAAVDYVTQVVAKANTSFYWGMRVLPPERRLAMFAIYAFCREVDDIADGDAPEAFKREQLGHWRDEIEALYAGRPSHPITRALSNAITAYDLPKAEFMAMIDGMETDAQEAILGMEFSDLLLYCRRVAGAVGMLSVPVFGDNSANAQRLAVVQGEALQLTNILRDIVEDADRNRLYLPHELLDKAGIASREPHEVARDPRLAAVCHELCILAQHKYREASYLMDQCAPKAMKPARLMMEVYRAYLRALERRGWKKLDQPIKIGKLTKLWIMVRYGVL
jgi:phytoene synthase